MCDVISKLREIQLAKRLTDSEMAKLLKCSRQTYQKTRTGNMKLGNKILEGISGPFPELKGDVLKITNKKFLPSNDNGLSKPVNNLTKQPSEAREGGLKSFCVGLLGRIKKWADLAH